MQKEIDNPVSREVVNKHVYDKISDYLPAIVNRSDTNMQSWSIESRLPEIFYKKWVASIVSNPRFREHVERKIENIFRWHVFNGQSFIEIRWSSGGASFETDGVNGCLITTGGENSYFSHNIDSFEQATILFLALSSYLSILYSALELYESKGADPEFPPLQKDVIHKRITLNNERQRKRKSEECQIALENFFPETGNL